MLWIKNDVSERGVWHNGGAKLRLVIGAMSRARSPIFTREKTDMGRCTKEIAGTQEFCESCRLNAPS